MGDDGLLAKLPHMNKITRRHGRVKPQMIFLKYSLRLIKYTHEVVGSSVRKMGNNDSSRRRDIKKWAEQKVIFFNGLFCLLIFGMCEH